MDSAEIRAETFHSDVRYLESLWQSLTVDDVDVPCIDVGNGRSSPLVFVPILQHLEFVYARQIRAFSQTRRVIMYRRRESWTNPVGLAERAEELRRVLDHLELENVDLVGHGDAAMVVFAFALRYPQRCHSLTIVAQGADYRIEPHPYIWVLHELSMRLPLEYFVPAWLLRRIVVSYIVASGPGQVATPSPGETQELQDAGAVSPGTSTRRDVGCTLPRFLIEEQFKKIARWPFVYKYSVLPLIHNYDVRDRLSSLTMPVLLINRAGDVLSPEHKTRWLAQNLPNCIGYHVVPGGDRFFMYAQSDAVNALMEQFLSRIQQA